MARLRQRFSKGGTMRNYKNNSTLVSGLGTLGNYIALGKLNSPAMKLPDIVIEDINEPEIPPTIAKPDVTPVVQFDFTQTPEFVPESTPVEKRGAGTQKTASPSKRLTGQAFVQAIYNSYYNAVRPGAASDADAQRQARYLTQKAAFETGYGEHLANTHNYGGHRTSKGWLSFKSMDDYTARDVKLLDKKWSNWRNATDEQQFVNSITTNNGYGIYAPRNEYSTYGGLTNRVKRYLRRPKAFLGAIIGAAAQIGTTLYTAHQQEKQFKEQRALERDKMTRDYAAAQSQQLALSQNAQNAYDEQFRMPFRRGGNIRIIDGGDDYYIGNGLHQVVGRPHETGGVGYDVNGEEIELENGEVWDKKNGSMRVFSDAIGINGKSFADLAKAGYDKNKLFKLQQSMNGDSHGRYRFGGRKKFLIGGDDDLSLPNTYLTEEQARAREAAIARAYFASNPSIGNLWSGFDHWLRSIGVRQAEGTGIQGGIAPVAGRGNVNLSRIQRGVQNIRNLSNKVLNATRRATPTSSVTHTPRIVNATESVAARAKSQVYPGYNWLRSKPYTNNAYADAALSRGVPESPYIEGSLEFPMWAGWRGMKNISVPYNFGTPAAVGTGVALASGLGYAVNKVRNNNSDNNTNKANVKGLKEGLASSLRRRLNLSLPTVGIPEIDLSNYTFREEASNNTNSGNTDTRNSQSSGNSAGEVESNISFTPNPDNIISPKEYVVSPTKDLDSSSAVTTISKDKNAANTPFGRTRNNLGLDLTTGDWIGLGANVLGGVGSWLINRNALRNMKELERPIPINAGKLVTNFDITPQLAINERARQASLNDIQRNTSSSVAGLDRRNLTNLNYATQAGALWSDKFNREVALLNEDTKNQQQVAMQNAALYNDYLTRLNEYRNQNSQLKAENDVAMVQGLGDAVNRFIAQGQQRYEDNNALRAYIASSHNGTAERLAMAGVDLGKRNVMIGKQMADYDVEQYSNDKTSDAYKQALERQTFWNKYIADNYGRHKKRYSRYRLFS